MKGITDLYQRFKSVKQFHNRLGLDGSEWPYSKLNGKPKTLINYVYKQSENNDSQTNKVHLGYEDLSDDIGKLEICRTTKRWADNLPREYVITAEHDIDKGKTIHSILDECKNTTSPIIQKQIMGIAKSFEDFGKDPSGKMDIEKNKQIYIEFFGRVIDVPKSEKYPDGRKYIGSGKTWRSLNDAIKKANKTLISANNSNKLDYYNQLERINLKYGVVNGATVVYDEEGILIVQIFSFQANSELNAQTKHCITTSISYWNTYVGGDDKFTNQYYLYNWNLPPSDDKSIIGLTIDQNGRMTDCCDKLNHDFRQQMPQYIEQLKKQYPELSSLSMNIFEPMTPEQVTQKKKRVAANKKIVAPNISIKDIITCIEDGADPNAYGSSKDGRSFVGKPLMNAVMENDHERVNLLINKGAQVTLCPCLVEGKDFEMLKILIRNGAEMDKKVYERYAHDYKSVRYLLDFGMPINYEKAYSIRMTIEQGEKLKKDVRSIVDLLFSRRVDFSERNYIAIDKAIPNPQLLEHLIRLVETKKFTMPEDCKTCNGATEIYKNRGTRDEIKEDCPHCNGTGKEPGGRMVEKTIEVSAKYELSAFADDIEKVNDEKYPNPQDKPRLLKMMMDYGMRNYDEEDVEKYLNQEYRPDINQMVLVKPILEKLESYRDLLTNDEKKSLGDVSKPKTTKKSKI